MCKNSEKTVSEKMIMEETEEGTVNGCDPSPWAPCPPGETNYTKNYSIKRKWYSGGYPADPCPTCGNKTDGKYPLTA